jgi:fluoride ion exporter CrcB/FEX
MLERLRTSLGLENYRALMLVAAGGVVGAAAAIALYWLNKTTAPTLPFTLATLFAGPVAALIAVVLILNVDRRDTLRLLVFAIVCGLAGKPILEAGSDFALELIGEGRQQIAHPENMNGGQ